MVGHRKRTPSPKAMASPEQLGINDTATLHLPRLLCLHGGGTNTRIFRMQCRMLEKRLRDSYRLVYAQAPIVGVKPGPDVTSVYEKYGPFRCWFRDEDTATDWSSQDIVSGIDNALAEAMAADNAAGATGDWAGLLGFSQGAKAAASILYRQQRCGGSSFRFAVLIAGSGPLVWLAPELPNPKGVVDADTPFSHAPPQIPEGSDEHVLWMPTIHVHGLNDPNVDRHQLLLNQYCSPQQNPLMEWDGDHRMPIKTRDVETLVGHIDTVAQEAETQFLVAQSLMTSSFVSQSYTYDLDSLVLDQASYQEPFAQGITA